MLQALKKGDSVKLITYHLTTGQRYARKSVVSRVTKNKIVVEMANFARTTGDLLDNAAFPLFRHTIEVWNDGDVEGLMA